MRVLVAGIGNIFLGDDGFGVEVVNRLDPAAMPAGAHVVDVGIRSVHLAYELLDGWDVLILIDAMHLGEQPGTVVTFQPDVDSLLGGADPASLNAHAMNPVVVLSMLRDLGGVMPRVLIVGCQPQSIDECLGLSDVVASAIAPAVDAVHRLVADVCGRADSFPYPPPATPHTTHPTTHPNTPTLTTTLTKELQR
jgi:hydrogenase maturation protease